MIVFDGEKWTIPKYKITRAVVVYDDRPELYPDGVAEEVTLNADQISRLEEIRYNTDMSMDQVEAYVIRGEGTPPDNRTLEEQLIDIVASTNPEALNTVNAEEWTPGPVKRFAIRKWKGGFWKAMHEIAQEIYWVVPPDESTLWFKVYGPSEDPNQIPEWDPAIGFTTGYPEGVIVTHKGKTWQNMVIGKSNVWEPGGAGVYDNIWKEVS